MGIVGVHVDDLLCGGSDDQLEIALKKLTAAFKFGDRKYPPVTYRGVDLIQDVKTRKNFTNQSAYLVKLAEPTVKTTNMFDDLRVFVGSMVWPATQTRPDLYFEASWLGSVIPDPRAEHSRAVHKLLNRTKVYAAVGLRFMKLEDIWQDVVLVAFSDVSWAMSFSGHSQAGRKL